MKKTLWILICGLLLSNVALAKTSLNAPTEMLETKDVKVFTQGEKFNYPLKEGEILECYAKQVGGSVDAFASYNDYFVMRNGHLYSNTMHKIYKPNKVDKLKKVDRVKLSKNGKMLQIYDPLWEFSIRHHRRTVSINPQTGEYNMTGTQDNWTWYRNIMASGYCRVISSN